MSPRFPLSRGFHDPEGLIRACAYLARLHARPPTPREHMIAIQRENMIHAIDGDSGTPTKARSPTHQTTLQDASDRGQVKDLDQPPRPGLRS